MDTTNNIKHYIIEDRGYSWLYHWIVYMIGGLRHIPIEDNKKIRIHINIAQDQGYHLESLQMISDIYNNCIPTDDCIKIYHHGEPVIRPDYVDPNTFIFLRTLFLSRINTSHTFDPLARYYITRKNSGTVNPANNGRNIRQILNDGEILPELEKLGIKCIHLENYSFKEKIRIFQTASMIISPQSGSLTFSIFANENTHIIEILPKTAYFHDHYKYICETLQIQFHRFTEVVVSGDPPSFSSIWNMVIDKDLFITYIKKFIK